MTSEHPLTYHEADGRSLPDQVRRYDELSHRDSMATARAALQARGEWTADRERLIGPAKYPPLELAERLELIALGEHIALYYRHPSQIDRAVRAGATWDLIAAATGTTAGAARAAYREWAEGQHAYAGMNDAEYAAALEQAGEPDAAVLPATAADDSRRLDAIRALLARFDWEHDDRQLALEVIERIAEGGQA